MITRALFIAAAIHVMAAVPSAAQPAPPVRLLDVPYIQQSEALCGGAAAAMVMRYWGATGVYAESFAPLVNDATGGIRAQDLLDDLRTRGWDARSFRGDPPLVKGRLASGQPVVALIEDRPGAFHFVVVVAWVNERIVYHDPARAPFRVVDERTFDAAWVKSDRWTMLALPGEGAKRPPEVAAAPVNTAATSACEGLVREGVAANEAGDRARALAVFSSAADVCPSDAAAFREIAGLQALDGNWRAAATSARSALDRDPNDEHAWRIVATSAYVNGDPSAALDAWNHVGEPRVDLVTVLGLQRTRHQVASGLLDLDPGGTLTPGRLRAAERRLADLPAAEAVRVRYTPAPGGQANVQGVVVERSLVPTSRASLLRAGAHLLTDREVHVDIASPTSGGELVSGVWRWWEERPRLAASVAVPSRAGIWRAEVFGEKQTYEFAQLVTESRRGGSVSLSNWTDRMLRWEMGVALDSWKERGRTGAATLALEQQLLGETLAVRASTSLFAGAFEASTLALHVDWRSRVRHERLVVLATSGVEAASERSPLALWSGAGTGHARGPLLRAHPLVEGGRIRGEVFGHRVYYGSGEVRRWARPLLKIVRIAPAVFVDAARAERRLVPGDAWHADAGVGLRLAAGGRSVFRADLARGLRDGAWAFSLGWAH